MKGCVAFEHTRDGPGEFVRQDTPGFPCVMLVRQPGQQLLSGLIPAQEEGGRFRKGPCEMGVPTLVSRSAYAFAPRVFGTLDEATLRRTILHPWEAIELVNVVEQDETEDFANARHRLQEVQGLGIGLFGRFEDKEVAVAEHLGIIGDQREGDCNGLVDRRGLKPLGDAFPIGFVGDFLADFGQVILAVGILAMR